MANEAIRYARFRGGGFISGAGCWRCGSDDQLGHAEEFPYCLAGHVFDGNLESSLWNASISIFKTRCLFQTVRPCSQLYVAFSIKQFNDAQQVKQVHIMPLFSMPVDMCAVNICIQSANFGSTVISASPL